MASPSVSVSTSVNESTKTISYTISYSAEYDPEPNEENYHRGETGYRYVNKQSDGSTSYQTEYDNGQSSKTITISYTWESRAIKREETGRTTVGNFSTEAEAQAYINSQSYPEDYVIISATPVVWSVAKLTYTYSVYTSGGLQNGSASATAYFTPKSQTQSPSASISAGTTSVTASVSNLSSDDRVYFVVTENGSLVNSKSETASGSNVSLTIGGLDSGKTYGYSVSVNGTTISSGSFTTTSPSEPSYVISSKTHSSVTLTVSNLSIGDQVKCTVYLASAEIGSDSAYATGGDVSLSVIGLDSDTEYTVTVIIVNQSKSLGTKQFTTSSVPIEGDFEWDTDIRAGAKMNSWQNPANGYMHPAPVTADEWNRLVELVKAKFGISIATVSRGERMFAGSGGNIRQVADALGVTVDSGDTITARFFLALRDAVNAKN